jgi:two-component system response regulator DegU
MPNTILLVDDHPVFRQGLRHILEKNKDLKVVGEAGDGLEAIDRFRELSPDIVVMDINMPNFDGIEATRQILSESPDTRVVALTVHSGKQFVRDMIEAGASGYILKESIPEEMIAGIRKVLSGQVYLSQSISDILISDYKTLISESEPEPDGLSSPILYTKLHPPPIASHIVPRTRLIKCWRMARGIQ